jgi:hypothetical protein
MPELSANKKTWVRGGVVVEALRYKLEGCGIDSRLCHWIFIDIILSVALWHYGVYSACNRNEYQQEYFLGVKAAGA